jgi:hypothetical protein
MFKRDEDEVLEQVAMTPERKMRLGNLADSIRKLIAENTQGPAEGFVVAQLVISSLDKNCLAETTNQEGDTCPGK